MQKKIVEKEQETSDLRRQIQFLIHQKDEEDEKVRALFIEIQQNELIKEKNDYEK